MPKKLILLDLFGVICLDRRRVNTELVEYIKELKPHYEIAILSNTSRLFLTQFLDENKLSELFDDVIASSETGLIKPQPEVFDYTAKRLGVSLSEIIFVDDSGVNVATARAQGITSILYETVADLREDIDALNAKGRG